MASTITPAPRTHFKVQFKVKELDDEFRVLTPLGCEVCYPFTDDRYDQLHNAHSEMWHAKARAMVYVLAAWELA